MQALYRGNGAHVLRLVPEVALRFTLHERLRVMCSPLDGRPIGPEGKLMAGGLTGGHRACACLLSILAFFALLIDISCEGCTGA